MKKILLALLFVINISNTSLFADAENDHFNLGIALCLSGGCAEWGGSALNGVKLAVEEINELGGIRNKKIKLIVEDTREAISGSTAIGAFNRLLANSKVSYIIGPSWTPAGLALIPKLKSKSHIIVITPSMAVPDFPRAASNLFKTVPDNSTTAEHIAEYAISKGLRSCAILSNQLKAEQYTSKMFTNKYESLGGKVVSLIETAPEETDLRTSAIKIIQSNPDVVFLANYVQLGQGARRLRELGYNGPFISILLDKTRLVDGGNALEGTVYSKYVSYSAAFDKKYRKRFNESYGPSADSAYDTVYVLKKAIESAETFNTGIVKDALVKVEMKGTASHLKFNQFRTVEKPPVLFVVKNGEAKLIG